MRAWLTFQMAFWRLVTRIGVFFEWLARRMTNFGSEIQYQAWRRRTVARRRRDGEGAVL